MVTHGLLKYIQNTVNPKPKELGSQNFERMFIPHYVSCVMCHMSHVMCHLSPVTCHMSTKKKFKTFFVIPKKIWQRGGASQWRVCYQRGLPRLVSVQRQVRQFSGRSCHQLYSSTLHCTALHCTALHCTALHCTALHSDMSGNFRSRIFLNVKALNFRSKTTYDLFGFPVPVPISGKAFW